MNKHIRVSIFSDSGEHVHLLLSDIRALRVLLRGAGQRAVRYYLRQALNRDGRGAVG